MSGARLLVVEDDVALARGLVDALAADGFEVTHVSRGRDFARKLAEVDPALVVLDLSLPDRPGLEILSTLRAAGDRRPVLVLTARREVEDRIVGLELGADDYLGKPFAVDELRARIRALLRRATGGAPRLGAIAVGRIRVDFDALSAVLADGSETGLSTHDLLVLKRLVEAGGAAVSRLDLVEEVCGLESDSTPRTIDNHVVALRRAIGDDPRQPRFLRTVRGVGYRLSLDSGVGER